jgi:hypothetical protein
MDEPAEEPLAAVSEHVSDEKEIPAPLLLPFLDAHPLQKSPL